MKYRIISTAGDDIYIFKNMRLYKRLFSANSGILLYLPNMTSAG